MLVESRKYSYHQADGEQFQSCQLIPGREMCVAFLSGFCNQLLRKLKELKFVTHHPKEGRTSGKVGLFLERQKYCHVCWSF